MRRYLAFLILLVALPAWADGDIFISKRKGAVAGGGGGPDTYYYGTGSDNYSSGTELETNRAFGDTITAVAAGSVTKIGFKINAKAGTADVKVMLVTGASTVHETQTIPDANLSVGWNDVTLATPYAIGASETVKVWMGPSSSYQMYLAHDGVGTGGYTDGTHAYATFGDSAPDGGNPETDFAYGVRIYVD